RRVAMVVEFQSEPDLLMLHRLLDYMGRLNLEQQTSPDSRGLYQIAGVLLNLTGSAQPDTLDMRLPDMPDYGGWARVVLRTLREEVPSATLTAIAASQTERCVLPWISLMHGADDPRIITQWRAVAEMETEGRLRSQYAGLALVFADL